MSRESGFRLVTKNPKPVVCRCGVITHCSLLYYPGQCLTCGSGGYDPRPLSLATAAEIEAIDRQRASYAKMAEALKADNSFLDLMKDGGYVRAAGGRKLRWSVVAE